MLVALGLDKSFDEIMGAAKRKGDEKNKGGRAKRSRREEEEEERENSGESDKEEGEGEEEEEDAPPVPPPVVKDWVKKAEKLLAAESFGPAWIALVAEWRLREEQTGFATSHRWGAWVQRARAGTPEIKDVDAFARQVRVWWQDINPAWRKLSLPMAKKTGPWTFMDVPGQNSFLNERINEESEEWKDMLEDVSWVLRQMNSSDACSNANGLANGNAPANADEEGANAAGKPARRCCAGTSAPTGTDVPAAVAAVTAATRPGPRPAYRKTMHGPRETIGQSAGPGPGQAVAAGGPEAGTRDAVASGDAAVASSVAGADMGESAGTAMLPASPVANPIDAAGAAAATEARKRAALECQGLSAEEIDEIMDDPDAEEDGMDIEDDRVDTQMEG
ncbi:hypothetical protein B0H14DRAFT_3001213 [Mycena olivaceomarginata]|nr:hypothetical protein B0H14DRAFT_3001213 [Mycena olivaceomarginata]